MGNSVYKINKGINKSIEFKGLKAQYIWYFAGGVVALLILFAIMYIIGINSFICMGIILGAGTVLIIKTYALSSTYGEYGMMKKLEAYLSWSDQKTGKFSSKENNKIKYNFKTR